MLAQQAKRSLKRGTTLDKYRIRRRLAEGPFASVYEAYDSIEGIRVALKIPHPHLMDQQFLDDFRREVRLASKLDHRNVLPVKNASFLAGHFVIVFPLGERTLADRLQQRMSLKTALDLAEQALEATAYAHGKRIIHCDIKPENLLLFPGDRLRLTDFGIARMALRKGEASGSGTIGYIAPEQAMGRPSYRSDVFSLGLVIYRMLAGSLPQWPYEWPPPGHDRLRRRVHRDFADMLRKALELDPRKRYRDAAQLLEVFRVARRRTLARAARRRRRTMGSASIRHWRDVRRRQFQRQYRSVLGTRFPCPRCQGPVAEAMRYCPWCGAARRVHRDPTPYPRRCPRCKRGIKADWRFCPWCYGGGMPRVLDREYPDRRYEARCHNPRCRRKVLMPYMRYCPACRTAVRRKWMIAGSTGRCPSCRWGVVSEFWSYCPWCGKKLARK